MPIDSLSLACATCAKSFQEAGGNAAGWAILFMLAVIVAILGTAGIFMVRIMRRERDMLDPKYRDH